VSISSDVFKSYASAYQTPSLVGRKQEVTTIESVACEQSGCQVICITGEGGIGKTKLLYHILGHLVRFVTQPKLVATDLIDLYHTPAHTVEGIMEQITHVLQLDNEQFSGYRAARWRLNELINSPSDNRGEISSQRNVMSQTFLKEYADLNQTHRVVLAFDTAERLVYQKDVTAERLEIARDISPDMFQWLLHDFLPIATNTVMLIAGRPPFLELATDFVKLPYVRYRNIPLLGLSVTEVDDYFVEVLSQAAESPDAEDRELASLLKEWPQEQRQVVFQSLYEEDLDTQERYVRPIILALAIDNLLISGLPLQNLMVSLDTAMKYTNADRAIIRDGLGLSIVNWLHTNRRPADTLILSLGWLSKGAALELLSEVSGIDATSIKNLLPELKRLSFVKVRPQDGRIFLHDEMYAFLVRHSQFRSSARLEKIDVYRKIADYYKGRIDTLKEELGRLNNLLASKEHTELSQGTKVRIDLEQITRVRIELETAMVEDLHYRLVANPEKGFETYFTYAELATTGNTDSLDMQLRAELLNHIQLGKDAESAQVGNVRLKSTLYYAALADAAIRWIKRRVVDHDLSHALELTARLRDQDYDLIEHDGVVAAAELDTWEGITRLYLGEVDKASDLLYRAVEQLQGMEESLGQRRRGVLAQAYNNLGYLSRTRGQTQRAEKYYRYALPLWRALNMEANHADTVKNLAFVTAQLGDLSRARRLGWDALELSQTLGAYDLVVRCLTTLAEIENLAGGHSNAASYGEGALKWAIHFKIRRGEGLAHIALAKHFIFLSMPSPMITHIERRKSLEKALIHSDHAIAIFSELAEPERLMYSYYSKGMALREQARLVGGSDPVHAELSSKSEEYYQKAQKLAQKHDYRSYYLDATLGLAWMYYYDHDSKLHQIVEVLETKIQSEFSSYLITPESYPQVNDDTRIEAFSQLARYHVLRGLMGLDREDLSEAAHHLTLSFEYDKLISTKFIGVDRAVNLVYNRLRSFSSQEIVSLFNAIECQFDELLAQYKDKFKRKEDLFFWQVIESHLGDYETHRQQATHH
jgi:tetratricopeptide (TPR) repeat protein